MSGHLPDGWVLTNLGQVCAPPMYGWTTRAARGRDGIRFLRTTDISRGPVDWSTVPACDEEPKDVDRYALASGDLIISRAGSVGLSALIEDCPPAVFASYLIRFRPSQGIEPRYLKWYLQSGEYWEQIGKASAGIALQNVNAKKLAAVQVPLAPLAEQRRIVAALEEHLSDLDAAVAGLERARANVTRYMAAVLEAAVKGELTGHTPSDGKPPAGWEWSTLGTLTDIQGGIQKQPKRQPAHNHYPFLRVANVQRGRLSLEDVHRIELFGNELERLRLERGDLLIVEGNGSASEIGRMAIWDGSIDDCVHQNHIIRARPKAGVRSEYLATYWNSPQGMRVVQAASSSTSGLHTLSVAKVSRVSLPLPPIEQQDAIVAEVEHRLAVANRTAAEIDVQLARAKRLRQSILKRAFEGRLVPQDPNDEPASVLLERIGAGRADAPATRRAGRRAAARR